jgi:DNA-binding CsgD family transcriptional regulator
MAASHPLPPPLDESSWKHVVSTLALAPQEACILELIMQSRSDKHIVSELGLTRSTVRTYLKRSFTKAKVNDRMELVHRVYAVALAHWHERSRTSV